MNEWGYYCAGLFVGMMVLGRYRPWAMSRLAQCTRWLSRKFEPEATRDE